MMRSGWQMTRVNVPILSTGKKSKNKNKPPPPKWTLVDPENSEVDEPAWRDSLPDNYEVDSPVDYFRYFFDNDLLKTIVDQSNLFAIQKTQTSHYI